MKDRLRKIKEEAISDIKSLSNLENLENINDYCSLLSPNNSIV